MGTRTADQHLCFHYIDSTMPKSEISSLNPSSVAVQPSLCKAWLETPKTGFLVTDHFIFLSRSSHQADSAACQLGPEV